MAFLEVGGGGKWHSIINHRSIDCDRAVVDNTMPLPAAKAEFELLFQILLTDYAVSA